MKNRLCIVFFIWQIFFASLMASPIFDNKNSNLWVMDTNTGQMSGYRQDNTDWTDTFISTGYMLQANEQVLVNDLPESSSPMNKQRLAPISLTGLVLPKLVVGVDAGMQALHITPASGGFTKTIMIEMAVDVNLANAGAVSLDWSVVGTKTITDNNGNLVLENNYTGSASLTSSSELRDGRLYARFYLVRDDSYTVDIALYDNAQVKMGSQQLSYNLTSNDPMGKRRDSDKDGLPDLVELAIGLDPLKGDWTTDSDNNGWSDFDEWLRGVEGLPKDSDGDGWSDFDEGLRKTEVNDLVQNLSTNGSPIPAPKLGTLEYKQKLQLFQDVPSATRLYEVEYVVSVTAVKINSESIWQSFSSYVPGSGVIFDSDELLTVDETKWADAGFAAIPQRRIEINMLLSLLISNNFTGLRLPASLSQVLDVRGNNKQTIILNEGLDNETTTEETRNWHVLQWLNAQADLTPKGFDAGTDWETVKIWKTRFIDYLALNLTQDLDLKLDLDSTTNTSLLLAVLAKEYALSGRDNQFIFDQKHSESQRIYGNLEQALRTYESGRTFDDVYADLLVLSATDIPFQSSVASLNTYITEMPWKQDSLRYLSVYATDTTAESEALAYISRLALFTDGVSELAGDATLGEIVTNHNTDYDSDGLTNIEEFANDVFAKSTYPWNANTDGDSDIDSVDPCPRDAQNLCQEINEIPRLTLSGSTDFTIALEVGQASYIVATVQLSSAYAQDISVDYDVATLTGNAVAGVDFHPMNGTLFIPAGETSATIIINLPEKMTIDNKTFYLILSNEQNATLLQTDYLVTVAALNSNANLDGLGLSTGVLSPVFDSLTLDYIASVNFATSSISVTPISTNGSATITVNGNATLSGNASALVDLLVGENIINISVLASDGVSTQNYSVTVTRQSVSSFAQQAYVKASNTGSGDVFGSSVALSGSTLVVGAYFERSDATGVNGDQTNDLRSNAGAVYVFTRSDAGDWSQQAYLKASEVGDGRFGYSVSLSGDTLAVGAPRERSNAVGVDGDQTDVSSIYAGAVYIFTRDLAGTWTQQAYVKASNTEKSDRFGSSVTLYNNTLAVGSPREDSNAVGVNGDESDNTIIDSGAAYIFTRDIDNKWSQQAYIKASNPGAGDWFGYSLAIFNDTLAVGAYHESSKATDVNGLESDDSMNDAGAVYVFTRDSMGSWVQQAYVKASNTSELSRFGISLALSNDTLVAGASGEGGSGAVYVFTRDIGNSWSEQAYIKASNTNDLDTFGISVSLLGDTLAAGAAGESSKAIGIDGDQTDNTATSSGAAYVFGRDVFGNWSQQAYIKALNTDASDSFGISIGLSNIGLAVGAHLEDSIAVGINGDQGDDTNSSSAGAVYLFATP